MLIEDVVKEYLYDIRLRNYTERTIKGYKNNILRFSKFIADEFEIVELEEISHVHIKKYLTYLKGKGLSETYINTILKNLRSLFGYCYKEGYCVNVAKKVSWLKEKKVVIKTFTDDEIRRMIDVYSLSSYIEARNKHIMVVQEILNFVR